jgi:WD40 repeat protein
VRSLAFHPGGRRLASAGGQKLAAGEIRIWDVENGAELLALRNRSGPFTGVAFSPDGMALASVDASGLREGEVRLWSAEPLNAPPHDP